MGEHPARADERLSRGDLRSLSSSATAVSALSNWWYSAKVQTPPSGETDRRAIELMVTIGDHQSRITTLEGVRAQVFSTAGAVLELAATVEPAGDGGRVALEAYEVVQVGPAAVQSEQSNLLSSHLLEKGDSAIIFGGRDQVRAELVRVRPATAEGNLRPIERCCISCSGWPSPVCACEVNTPCGSCSTGC